MERAGAHIGDPYNQNSVAVCLAGNFSEEYPTAKMANILVFVCNEIAKRYEIPAIPRFHRDVDATACPGWNITHELVAQWFAGNTGYQLPTSPSPVSIPAPDLTFTTKPNVPFPPFTFIIGNGEALGLGDESPQVRDLEMCLYFLGYISYTPNTYLYDEYAEAGVKAFQEKFNPPVDGIYGWFTATALQKEVDRIWTGHSPIVEPPNPPGNNPDQGAVSLPSPPRAPQPVTPTEPQVEDSILEHLKPGEEVKPLLEKILALLTKLTEWFKQIFRIEE